MSNPYVYVPNPGGRETKTDHYCPNCQRYRDMNQHGRCDFCESEVTYLSGALLSNAR